MNLLERDYPASAEVLARIRADVRAALAGLVCDEDCVGALVLAINEACMNVIAHAYAYATGKTFVLRLDVDDEVLTAVLLDNGQPVSNDDLQPRAFEDLRPGGLGVRFMRELTDEVTFVAPPPGFVNCLRLRKRLARK